MIRSILLFLLVHHIACIAAAQNHLFKFTSQKISADKHAQMIYTWNESSPVPLQKLRYITVTHYDFDGYIRTGELVVHERVVDDLEYIFKKLFEAAFPIASMKLVDAFDGSDLKSMQANNTSAFYARKVAGTNRWSNHAFGCAIDINPVLNPYSNSKIEALPLNAKPYLDRTQDTPGMITKDSYIYHLFKEKGWQWGGECFFQRDGVIDRHHFQKIIPGINSDH